jgi:hypothetical protein
MGGRVRVYRRSNSSHWQCATYIEGKEWRASTRHESAARADTFAEDWYLELMGKLRSGSLKGGKTFTQAAEKFLPEYKLLTQGERNAEYVRGHGRCLSVHLLPFFGDKVLSEITPVWCRNIACIARRRARPASRPREARCTMRS